ncbi:CU044_5270 family protein [Amycolatopsis sp. NBC_01286]|uniref:CU044_5270 family protein n=1 Tax=Amycolatopsis sp. NBC_01286 TaxID=2903560 RepID=UPI002E0E0766|nr:CU044_5270 family protein [Amycolatopsis sp. NBC_01286]
MNDLQTLRAALTPDEPTQDVVDRSRHRLQNHMLTGRRRRHVRPLAIGTGLVAVAAAAAVVVTTVPGTPAQTPTPAPQAAAPVAVTGQEVLLAAATVAAKAPAGTGKYWHLKIAESETYEYWTTAEGHQWFRGAKTGGRVIRLVVDSPFHLSVVEVTLDQLLALPTEPAALRDWISNALERSEVRTSAGPMSSSERQELLPQALVSLVSTLPAPPAVRAAAFRAIAAYPGVRALGAVPGGQGLLLPGNERLVVDPATGRVNRTSMYVTPDGAVMSGTKDTETITVGAEWTNSLPQ